MQDFRISPQDRARFNRCRRQWDFGSPNRRDLEPLQLTEPALPSALREALAVYYYPGTWDWPHQMTQSLVQKALDKSLSEAGASDELPRAAALMDCYDAWAKTVDDFAPVKINHDLLALVPDPRDPELGLVTPDGSAVKYSCEIDLVAADQGDEYWVVFHRVVDDWCELESLVDDEGAVAACWAWEHDFIGVVIAGTIHNEVRTTGPLKFPEERGTRAVPQSPPSGGGRSIPQHERVLAREARVGGEHRVEQQDAGVLRRTRIRRSRDEIAAVPGQLAAEMAAMTGDPAITPTFAEHCADCEFNAPCLAMFLGQDPEPLLAANFRQRPTDIRPKPKLGQSTWGFGRGAAPPNW